MNCAVCDSHIDFYKRYDNHLTLCEVDPPGGVAIENQAKGSGVVSGELFRGVVGICSVCGHGEMQDAPSESELKDYYETEYWKKRAVVVESAAKGNDIDKSRERAASQIDFVFERIPEFSRLSSALEIGAGAAHALIELGERIQDSDTALSVCEPGLQWEDHYRRAGIERIASYFPFRSDTRFDYVHTSHWLEHVVDLDETLAQLRSILRPSSFLFMEVPNTQHFYWDLHILDTPHVHFFTPESLRRLFQKHGFESLGVEECGITFLDRYYNAPQPPETFGPRRKGYWIRGLFRLSE